MSAVAAPAGRSAFRPEAQCLLLALFLLQGQRLGLDRSETCRWSEGDDPQLQKGPAWRAPQRASRAAVDQVRRRRKEWPYLDDALQTSRPSASNVASRHCRSSSPSLHRAVLKAARRKTGTSCSGASTASRCSSAGVGMPLSHALRIGAFNFRSAQGVQVREPDNSAGCRTCRAADVRQTDPRIAQLAIVEGKNFAPQRGRRAKSVCATMVFSKLR
jgi:hypothetical protein